MTHPPSARLRLRPGFMRALVLGTGLMAALVTEAPAQSAPASDTSAFAGLGENRNAPIQIEADQLEVREKDKTAVFSGNVSVRQDDATLRTQRLVVFYTGEGSGLSNGAGGAPQQNISRLEATGKVLVTSRDQTATGDQANFDVQARKLELSGNVTLTQGKNVLRGGKLLVDLTTGEARMVSSAQRVQMLLVPNSPPPGGTKPTQ